MKILETQSAVLSNIEVLDHLRDVDSRYAAHPDYTSPSQRRDRKAAHHGRQDGGKLRGLRSAVKDAISYLSSTPTLPASAEGQRAEPQPQAVARLVEQLARYPTLTKGEKLMVVNLRPTDTDALEVIVEEAEARLTEQEREEIVTLVGRMDGAG